MDRNFNKLVEEIKNYSIDDIKEKTRNKIIKRIEELRKNDDLFLKEHDSKERCLWRDILFNNYDETLRNLINYYNSVISLKYEVDLFFKRTN